jgi:hypothetical protein
LLHLVVCLLIDRFGVGELHGTLFLFGDFLRLAGLPLIPSSKRFHPSLSCARSSFSVVGQLPEF